MGEGFGALFEFDPAVMCVRYHMQPRLVMSAIGFLDRAGYFNFIEELETRSRVMIRLQRDELYDVELEPRQEELMHHLLRNYPGLFADYVFVDEVRIAIALGCKPDDVYKMLVALRREHIIYYVPRTSTPYIYFTANRTESSRLTFPREIYELRQQKAKERIEAMKSFAYDDDHCRVATMLKYFGEDVPAGYACGKCDVCRSRRSAAFDAAWFEPWFFDVLEQYHQFALSDLDRVLPRFADEAAAHIRELVKQGKLKNNDGIISKC